MTPRQNRAKARSRAGRRPRITAGSRARGRTAVGLMAHPFFFSPSPPVLLSPTSLPPPTGAPRPGPRRFSSGLPAASPTAGPTTRAARGRRIPGGGRARPGRRPGSPPRAYFLSPRGRRYRWDRERQSCGLPRPVRTGKESFPAGPRPGDTSTAAPGGPARTPRASRPRPAPARAVRPPASTRLAAHDCRSISRRGGGVRRRAAVRAAPCAL